MTKKKFKNKEKVRKSEAQSRGSVIQPAEVPEREMWEKGKEIIKEIRKFLKTKGCKSSAERSCTKAKCQGR